MLKVWPEQAELLKVIPTFSVIFIFFFYYYFIKLYTKKIKLNDVVYTLLLTLKNLKNKQITLTFFLSFLFWHTSQSDFPFSKIKITNIQAHKHIEARKKRVIDDS